MDPEKISGCAIQINTSHLAHLPLLHSIPPPHRCAKSSPPVYILDIWRNTNSPEQSCRLINKIGPSFSKSPSHQKPITTLATLLPSVKHQPRISSITTPLNSFTHILVYQRSKLFAFWTWTYHHRFSSTVRRQEHLSFKSRNP